MDEFGTITEELLTDPEVSEGRMFGSQGLKVAGKVFAMEVKDRLVVKLPRERVDELVAAGTGAPFDPGHGRLMKEWIAIPRGRTAWLPLVEEARRFVEAQERR